MSTSKFTVAVIGGGIAGLTLAAAVGAMDPEHRVEIDLYEATAEFGEIGAGINVWPRVWSVLKELGLEKSVIDLLPEYPDDKPRLVFNVRKSDQKHGVEIRDIYIKGGSLRFHRADFQRTLLKHVPPNYNLHTSKRLINYVEHDDHVEIEFQDGSRARCDILIAADGIKSRTRRIFLRSFPEPECYENSLNPVWSGMIAYRGLVPMDKLSARCPNHRVTKKPMMYVGKMKHLIVYPVAKNQLINVVAFYSDFTMEGSSWEGPTFSSATREEVLDKFRSWEDEVFQLLDCIETPTKWAIQAVKPFDCWGKGKVVLMGDAAHAMTPHQGTGAGQAIEDAYILASLLTNEKCNKKTLSTVSKVFSEIRQPVGNKVLDDSRKQGMRCQLVASGFDDVEEGREVDIERLRELFEDFSYAFDWVWNSSADKEREEANNLFSMLCSQ
ncbi:salicylate hydroxylase [Cyathus striatus]|nr:salicylate hydroxylase [Cyathus striatus]